MICLISRPILIASRRDWYLSKGLFKGFKLALRPWESSKNWWRYDQMKFMTLLSFSSTLAALLVAWPCMLLFLSLSSSTSFLLPELFPLQGMLVPSVGMLFVALLHMLPFPSFPIMDTPYTCVPFLYTYNIQLPPLLLFLLSSLPLYTALLYSSVLQTYFGK